jgi:ribonucleoside-diphosphate reductase alpha chain
MTELEMKKQPEILPDFNKDIFIEKYAVRELPEADNLLGVGKPLETEPSEAFERVAKTLAEAWAKNVIDHPEGLEKWSISVQEMEFYKVMAERRGIVAGRALLALGNPCVKLTALNCFVVPVDDSIDSILGNSFEAASKIQQAGGGFGANFSSIRPKGAHVKGVNSTASGPLSFMDTWDSMIATMKSAGNRRGAGIAILDINHPDILEFITAKKDAALTNFNVSVGITNDFVEALREDKEYELRHGGKIYGKLKARAVFDKLVNNAYNYNEPGIFFKDRVNDVSNTAYYQKIESTNPCGEIPLPPWGCCDLGMVILPTFVKNPFISQEVDIEGIKETVRTLVFMLDTVLDVTNYPLKKNEKVAIEDRRIGLGITGLADMLAMLKIKYDSDEAISFVDVLMQTIRNAAYEASIELSKLKGPFSKFDKDKFISGKFIRTLPENIIDGIAEHGIRNCAILTCQPAGTISLLLNNVSSGIEPIFSLKQKRRMRDEQGNLTRQFDLLNYSYKYFKSAGFDKVYSEKPDFFQTTKDVTLQGHLRMQNTIQKYVDNSISKTINFPEGTDFNSFKDFMFTVLTSDMSIKGLTTFREGTIQSILTDEDARPTIQEEDAYRRRSFTYQIKRSSGLPSAHIHVTHSKGQVSQVFVVSRDVDFYKQQLPYCRLLSMMFNREKNPERLLEILQELEDMDYVEEDESYTYKGKTYSHFLAAMKECIWDCLVEIGLIRDEEAEDFEEDESDIECPNCKAKNSMVKDGKCWICNICGSSPPGSVCSI